MGIHVGVHRGPYPHVFDGSVDEVVLGVLEIPYQEFPGTYQRTGTVPAECPNAPIVWVNSIDQLVRAGTSWYELVRR